MENEPLVSAVIPTYNCGHYVVEAVESACAQTYPRLEVIVVDDGSGDDTRQRLRPYFDRITYLHQENRGLSAARNRGIQAAQGEWIALLDADDRWHREKTAVQLRAAREAGCALVGSAAAATLPEVLPPEAKARLLSVEDYLLSAPIGPSGAMISKQCLSRIGPFDETLRAVEDRDMWLRIAADFPTAVVDSPCWWYRIHEGQMNRQAERMGANYRRVLDRFFAEHAEHAHLRAVSLSYMYADLAWSYFLEGNRHRAMSYLLHSLWLHPAPYRGAQGREPWWRSKHLVRYALGTKLFQAVARRI
ncbi:MAG TPA: glycosyltransferase family A protein [Pirellulales bacterium]|nr:glycosyltransferase family A protein [Pirellulales bacterium]